MTVKLKEMYWSKGVMILESLIYTSTSIKKDKVFWEHFSFVSTYTFHAIKGQNGQEWLLISWHVNHTERVLWWPVSRSSQVFPSRGLTPARGPPVFSGEVISHALLVNKIYNSSMMQDHQVRKHKQDWQCLSFTFLWSISKIRAVW